MTDEYVRGVLTRVYNPSSREAKILIEHTYDKWDRAYGSFHENVATGHILTPYGEKEQRYERKKHACFFVLSPEYAHYVCIKAVRYCRLTNDKL